MALKACITCGRAAVRGAYCERCARRPVAVGWDERVRPRRAYKPRNKARRKPTAWEKLSKSFLARNPTCVACALQGKVRPARHSDHVRPWKWYPELRYEESNLQALCVACHAKKSGREARGFLVDYRKEIVIEMSPEQLKAAKQWERQEMAARRDNPSFFQDP